MVEFDDDLPPPSARRVSAGVREIPWLDSDHDAATGIEVADPLPDPERRGLRHAVVDVTPRVPAHGLHAPFQVVVCLVVGAYGWVPAGGDEAAGGAP